MATAENRAAPTITIGAAGALGSGPGRPSAEEMAANIFRAYGKSKNLAGQLPIVGSAHQAAEWFAADADAGATHLVIGLAGAGWREQCEVLAEARERD
ncbi:hypothetical protein KOI35_03020 [Actinoplanes bogorensis]|uniref:Uncharacterized protein n=1 Tax=Paractinoplanes bogorensis TaxID=1610840 RepID=A0ABS5YG59_9ACTN|nr:hypothetical protein [Actinoplanes bogorensis]MBU2662474.1 hypothetical protein [Actinoplanes bogorensis]